MGWIPGNEAAGHFFFEVFRGYLEGFASEKRYIEAKYYFALCSFCV